MAISAIATLGCGDSEDGAAPKVSVTDQNLCSEVAQVLCHNIFQCCTGAQIEDDFGLEITNTENECRRDIELQCEETNAELLYSIQGGTVALDRTKANTCLKSVIVKDQCFVVLSEPMDLTACADMFIGQQAEGKDCPFGWECADNLYCAKNSKCHSLPGVDEACPSNACAEGLYCEYDTEAGERSCQPLKKSGQKCSLGQLCETALFCDYDAQALEGTCSARQAAGEPCESNSQCLSSECLPGLCDNGDECFTDDDCGGQCATSGASCYNDYDCDGLCELSGSSCESQYDCDYLNDEACLNEACQPGSCNGQPVCGQYHYVVDYCEINPLPTNNSVWE